MQRENIETIIRELFRQNYNAYPDSYHDTVAGSINTALDTAKGYWDYRDETEIERDTQVGVALTDYENWVKAELAELKNKSVN